MLFFPQTSHGQKIGFHFPNRTQQIEVPFELYGHFVVVKVSLNHALSLNFIVDTGAENTMLLKKEISDLLEIPYDPRTLQVVGANLDTLLNAHIARRVTLSIKDAHIVHDILVLSDDVFGIDELIGIQVHGILGADLFNAYQLDIDYDRRKLIIRENGKQNPKGFTAVPMQIHRFKPYISTSLNLPSRDSLLVNLLLDTGADLDLLLYNNTHPDLAVPSNAVTAQIGHGLTGGLTGYMGRTNKIQFSHYNFVGLPTHFQVLPQVTDSTQHLFAYRNGILGGRLLSRFHVIFDFSTNTLFLKPSRNYNQPFRIDRSGLTLLATGVNLNQLVVAHVLPNSPAAMAGLVKGDFILSINGTASSLIPLRAAQYQMSSSKNKRFRIKFLRQGLRSQATFVLADII